MKNKLLRRCKKCDTLFDVWQSYRAPADIKYYLGDPKTQIHCPRCTILKVYKHPLRPHDWRVRVAAFREKWERVR